jgi:hypothetical protein
VTDRRFQIIDPAQELRRVQDEARDWARLPRDKRRAAVLERFERFLEEAQEQAERPLPAARGDSPADGVDWQMRSAEELILFHLPLMADAIAAGKPGLAAMHGWWFGWAAGVSQTWPQAYHGARRERKVAKELEPDARYGRALRHHRRPGRTPLVDPAQIRDYVARALTEGATIDPARRAAVLHFKGLGTPLSLSTIRHHTEGMGETAT